MVYVIAGTFAEALSLSDIYGLTQWCYLTNKSQLGNSFEPNVLSACLPSRKTLSERIAFLEVVSELQIRKARIKHVPCPY